jgi:hypothetical protein
MAERKPFACAVPRCGRTIYALGLCTGHYQQFNRMGRITSLDIRPRNTRIKPCGVNGCTAAAVYVTQGLCRKHYRIRLKRPPCTIEGCDHPQVGKGLCNMHYLRVRRYGDPSVNKGWGPERWKIRQEAN